MLGFVDGELFWSEGLFRAGEVAPRSSSPSGVEHARPSAHDTRAWPWRARRSWTGLVDGEGAPHGAAFQRWAGVLEQRCPGDWRRLAALGAEIETRFARRAGAMRVTRVSTSKRVRPPRGSGGPSTPTRRWRQRRRGDRHGPCRRSRHSSPGRWRALLGRSAACHSSAPDADARSAGNGCRGTKRFEVFYVGQQDQQQLVRAPGPRELRAAGRALHAFPLVYFLAAPPLARRRVPGWSFCSGLSAVSTALSICGRGPRRAADPLLFVYAHAARKE